MKMDLIEIFKRMPQGTPIYSALHGKDLYYKYIDYGLIYFSFKENPLQFVHFYRDGSFSKDGECMIWPSNELRDWTKFNGTQLNFSDGEILYVKGSFAPWLIAYKFAQDNKTRNYVSVNVLNEYIGTGSCICDDSEITEYRLATEEERKKFDYILSRNDLFWNDKDKKIEELRVLAQYYFYVTDNQTKNNMLQRRFEELTGLKIDVDEVSAQGVGSAVVSNGKNVSYGDFSGLCGTEIKIY